MTVATDWLARTPFAHRGLHDGTAGVPENSLASFHAAIAAGYGIELDLQLTGDGEAVVFHDDDLDRVTDLRGPIAAQELTELREARLLGGDKGIPTLREALELIRGQVPLLVEIKNWRRPVGTLEALVVGALQDYDGAVAMQSFNPASVNWFRLNEPGIARGQISSRFRVRRHGRSSWQLFLIRNLLSTLTARPHFINYDIEGLPHPAPSLARRLGIPLLAWTVRTDAQLRKARTLVDNVVFEQIRP